MSKRKKQKKTTSKIEYDGKHHPTAFRSDPELEEIIQAVQKELGLSRSGAIKYQIKLGAGKFELRQRSEQEIRDKAYQEGFLKAKSIYAVQYKCAVCGKPLIIKSDAEKKAVAQYFKEHVWGHAECNQRAAPSSGDMLVGLAEIVFRDGKGSK